MSGDGISAAPLAGPEINDELASLRRPRKHYQWYYSSLTANTDMINCPEGIHKFLRAYFHVKSADWIQNQPFPLKSWTATELAKMPTYYIMDSDKSMPETVGSEMPTADQIIKCGWLSDNELKVYSDEFLRTGFQGGLQWYRVRTGGELNTDAQKYSGQKIEVPVTYIAGKQDWGTYQVPGNFERMQSTACKQFLGYHLVEGAGHWVQQEQPLKVSRLLVEFIHRISPS
jgi:pimeloyl-ACP methyl ester carboxylesterase